MTSLIDVIFLLLLFFMLSSTFSKFADVQLTLAVDGGLQTSPHTKLVLSLRSNGLLLNGRPVVLEDLRDRLRVARGDEVAILLISIAPDTNAQQLVETLAAAQGIENLNVTVLQ